MLFQGLDIVQSREDGHGSHPAPQLLTGAALRHLKLDLPARQLVAAPVDVAGVLVEAPDAEHGLVEGPGALEAIHHVLVEELHEDGGTLVGNSPEGGEDGLGPGQDEGPGHALDAVGLDGPSARVAAGEHHQGRADVQLLDVLGIEKDQLLV